MPAYTFAERLVRETLFLRRIAEISGVPEQLLRQRIEELRGGTGSDAKQVEELWRLRRHLGLAEASCILRDKEAEGDVLRALCLGRWNVGLVVSRAVQEGDFFEVWERQFVGALKGEGDSLWSLSVEARAKVVGRHWWTAACGREAFAEKILASNVPWEFVWPDKVEALRACRLIRERTTMIAKLWGMVGWADEDDFRQRLSMAVANHVTTPILRAKDLYEEAVSYEQRAGGVAVTPGRDAANGDNLQPG